MVPEELSMGSTSSDPQKTCGIRLGGTPHVLPSWSAYPRDAAAISIQQRNCPPVHLYAAIHHHTTRYLTLPQPQRTSKTRQASTQLALPVVYVMCKSKSESLLGALLQSGLQHTGLYPVDQALGGPGVKRAAQTPVTVRKSGTRMKLVARKRPPNRKVKEPSTLTRKTVHPKAVGLPMLLPVSTEPLA